MRALDDLTHCIRRFPAPKKWRMVEIETTINLAGEVFRILNEYQAWSGVIGDTRFWNGHAWESFGHTFCKNYPREKGYTPRVIGWVFMRYPEPVCTRCYDVALESSTAVGEFEGTS